MVFKIKKNNAVFLLLFSINLMVSIVAYFILPAKFFSDTKIIILDKYHEIGYIGSYPLSILFYKITFLKYLPFPIIALIQYPILIYILYKIGVPNNFHKITVKNIIVYIGFFILAIFASMPSKEFINFVFMAIIPFIFKSEKYSNQKKIILSVFLMLFFGAIFRPYYIFIPIISIAMMLFSKIKIENKTISTVTYGLLIAVFMSLSYGVITHKHLSESSREILNKERAGDNAHNSMIVSPVSTATWYGESIGVIYGFFAVNVPIEGIKHFLSPQILAFVLWQLIMFYIFLVRLSWSLKHKNENQLELWLLCFVFSYFIVQGIFEPDLGSAVRHKMGFLPLIYFALYYDYFRKKV
jgi:hypothetical protein